MAAGIEIAGLVLAAIPLFIEAAERYRSGINFVKRALKKELFATRYKEELTQQQALLSLYIKSVVGKTGLPSHTQLALVSNPLGEVWKQPDVTKQLSAQLAEAYQPFLDTMARLSQTFLKQIKEETGADVDDSALVQKLRDLCLQHGQKSTSTADTTSLFDRIKFSWKSSQREEMLCELAACNTMLEKLSNAAERAKPFARKQQTRRVHAAYEHREVTQRLFDILRNACNCTPAQARQVGLRLKVHADDKDDDEHSFDSTFEIILFLSQTVIFEISAKIIKAMTQPPKKRVRINAPGRSQCSSQTGTPSSNMKLLDDICREASHAHACKSCFQLVVDKHEKIYCSSTRQATSVASAVDAQEVLSLTDIMSRLKLYERKRWLHREKSILAIILAYSLLQLHDSPWSQIQWTSSNIAFVDNGITSVAHLNAGAQLPLRRPYTRSQVAATKGIVPHPMPARRNAHLHALGVILLELYLNRSIQEDVALSGTNDHRSVAQDLLEDHADDISMTPEYHEAVRFCLSPSPNPCSGSCSFDDEGFREIYYEKVIAMLEENLTSRFEVNEDIWLKNT